MATKKLLANEIDNKKFKYWIKQFIIKSKIFKKQIKEYESSIVGYIGHTPITFFRHKEWFYVSYGMNTLKRRNFLSFLKSFGNTVNQKKDQLFQKIGDILVNEIQLFLSNFNFEIKENDVKNYSKFKRLNILIHKIARIKYSMDTGILSINISEKFKFKKELIEYIKNNFFKITRLKFLRNLIFEIKESLLMVRAPIGFLENYVKGLM